MRPHPWLVVAILFLPVLSAAQIAPVGGELTVAQASAVFHRSPAVAAGETGSFVVVWERNSGGSEGWDILARLYDPNGSPLGPAFVVNATTAGCQQRPAVAADRTGSFVVVWQSEGQDGSGWGIFGRRFTSGGVALGGEIPVTTATAGDQRSPAVARHPDGAFLVAWQSEAAPPDGSSWGVFARGFDAAGMAVSPAFPVNAATAGAQFAPRTAFLPGAPAHYVVVWQSQGQDGSGSGIYRRTFALDGTAQSSEVRVNAAAAGSQIRPAVAADASGNFIVFWESLKTGLAASGLSGQRFNASSQPLGSGIAVNPLLPIAERRPSVTSDAAGNFIVAWERENGDGDGSAVYARLFDHLQLPRSPEFLVSSTASGDQDGATGAAAGPGAVFLAWGSAPSGGDSAVLAQRYAISGLDFHTLPPCRVVDTRQAPGPFGGPALAAGAERTFTIAASTCGVPLSARAISINLTVTGTTGGGQVVLYPGDMAATPTSSVSFLAGHTRGNNAVAPLSRDGLATLSTLAGMSAGTQVHLILDVNGYFE
ncbi:MAG TPA: hypothetical protein VN493_03265 [Thermoanaerobaculia bacterium]|nr:hypothetical protein [Thermoanaerobaculia bacterium]